MRVQLLGQEDPLEEGMAIHSSIHKQRIPWSPPSLNFWLETQALLQAPGSPSHLRSISDWSVCASLKKELRPFLSPNCFLTAFPLFLHSFVPLRSVITESCSRASTVARLRPKNGLSKKWLILYQESHDWFYFSVDPVPYLLIPGQESPLGTLLCPLLREACPSAPGPWPRSSISYC